MPLPYRRHHVSVRRDGERLHLPVRDARGRNERAVRSDSAARLRIRRGLPFAGLDREPHADVAHRHRGVRGGRRRGGCAKALEVAVDLVGARSLAARLHAEGLHVADPVLYGLGLRRGTRPLEPKLRRNTPENVVVEEHHVVDGKALAPHARRERLAGLLRRRHRLVHQFRRVQLVVSSEEGRALVSALHDLLRLARTRLDHRDELLEDRRGVLAVVSFNELVHEPLLVVLRIPEEMRRHVVPQRRERPGRAERVALLEHAHGAVRGEETDVRRDGFDVRMRHHVVVEVGEVVPDEKVAARHAPPVGEVLREVGLVRRQRLGERTREVALDVAEAHHHVVARTRLRGRLARELVRERVDAHVRELLLHRLGDVVREAEVRPRRRAAVLVHHGLALLARAVSAPVVLRHLYEIDGRILAQALQRLLDVLRLHLLVRKAQLLRLAFSVDERIPFRMLLEIHLGRQHLEEGMVRAVASLEEVEAVVAAKLGRDELDVREKIARERREVALRTHLEEWVEAVEVVRLAILELRSVLEVDAGDGGRFKLRVRRLGGSPPPHAAVFLEIEVNCIDRRARGIAVQHHAVGNRFQEHLVHLVWTAPRTVRPAAYRLHPLRGTHEKLNAITRCAF